MGFEVDGDQGRKGREKKKKRTTAEAAWSRTSYSCLIINMRRLKTVDLPSCLYLKNIDKVLNLISQIIFKTGNADDP